MLRQIRLVALSLGVGILLMLIKFFAFFLTESNAIFSDASESIVNVLASSFAFYSIYLSSRPKDENHPYGHGKVEFFSMFVEGGLIFIAGSIILIKSIYSIFFPQEIENIDEGLLLILFTALVNFGIGWYLKVQGTILKSMTIETDGKHLQIDALSSIGLIGGLLIMKVTQMPWIDILLSSLLGLYILFSGYKILRKSISGLMDENNLELFEQVVDILREIREDDWIDVHNMRIQQYGRELHIDCHLTLPKYYTLTKVHEKISNFENSVQVRLGVPVELFIHVDPCEPLCCNYCQVKDCPIRAEAFAGTIEWKPSTLLRNRKHYNEIDHIRSKEEQPKV